MNAHPGRKYCLLAFILLIFGGVMPPLFAADFSWTITPNGLSAWQIQAVSSPDLTPAVPADNPTINLIVGKRYAVTILNPSIHTLQYIAKGANAAKDVVLLEVASHTRPFETDASVNFVSADTTHFEFTLTQALVDAATATGLAPGYRCGVHTTTMRGDYAIFGNGTVITNPIPESIIREGLELQFTTMTATLISPLGVVAPNDSTNRIFIFDQAGKIYAMPRDGGSASTFLDVTSRIVTLDPTDDERGLLGLALHPDFSSNRKFYTYTSEPVSGAADFTTTPMSTADHQSVIAEWQAQSGNPNAADVASRREIMRIDEPQSNHNGGHLAFGPDGKLYLSLGDGGAANDVGAGHDHNTGNGQNINVVYGKILRIDVNTTTSANGKYGIPADNPFAGKNGLDEIYAYGLRNPYSFSFDRTSGQLYMGDVGQNNVEEIDIITSGGNFGWHYKEGSFFFNWIDGTVVTAPLVPVPSGMIDPIAEYDHDEGIAIIGGHVYRGSLPLLQGKYIFADLAGKTSGRLFYLNSQGKIKEFGSASTSPLGYFVKGFGEDLSGEIYICLSKNIGPSGATGTVVRISGATLLHTTQAQGWVLY